MSEISRIQILEQTLINQIAAGEVVERPASVVKELVENAIDAQATRIQIDVEEGGRSLIRVLDNGIGIHPEDLPLAVTRHATSKLHAADELMDIHTLGFRGEALASITAVANVYLRSRPSDASTGYELHAIPGQQLRPIGMPIGTQVEVRGLFANLPARQKFMRSEATEVGHCCETILKIALVHPEVHFLFHHGRRELINLRAGSLDERVQQILERRASGPFFAFTGEEQGVVVKAWLGDPRSALQGHTPIYIVVRKRVVRERNLSQIVSQAYGSHLASGRYPIACLMVEPPPSTVDVNVHPQKSEVRFAEPQSVYSSVRRIFTQTMSQFPWLPNSPDVQTREVQTTASSQVEQAREAVQQWNASENAKEPTTYRLATRALTPNYAQQKQELRATAARLQEQLKSGASPPKDVYQTSLASAPMSSVCADGELPANQPKSPEQPQFLTCLPGPVALFSDAKELIVVDLYQLRSFLVYRRLLRDITSGHGVAIQQLLTPVIIACKSADVEIWLQGREELRSLGIDLDAFGEDAIVVRGVPGHLRSCTEEADIKDLMERVLPWLRLREQKPQTSKLLEAIAKTKGADPAPRLAKRWLAEALEFSQHLDEVPGLKRWSVAHLLAT